MNLLETIKSLNPLKKLVRTPATRVANGLLDGQTLMEMMRDASDGVARRAVARALEEFSDGPAALLITCLIEATTDGWVTLGREVKAHPRLPPERALWVGARLNDYGRSLGSEVMTQHLINLVLNVTGLHVEALILTRAEVDARRLTDKLTELLKQGLSSGLSRADLGQTLVATKASTGRLASAS